MKKVAVVGVLVVAGIVFYKYRQAGASSAEVRVYQAFMKALRSTDVSGARELATGDQVERDIRAFTRREADRYRVRGSLNIHRAAYKVESRSEEGGTVQLEILEELRVDPPGATSSLGVANVWLRHDVEMQKVDGQWRVAAFEVGFEDAEGMDGISVDDAHTWF